MVLGIEKSVSFDLPGLQGFVVLGEWSLYIAEALEKSLMTSKVSIVSHRSNKDRKI